MALRSEKLSFLFQVARADICGSFGRYYHVSEVGFTKLYACSLRIPAFRSSNIVPVFIIDLSAKSNK